MFRFVFPTCNGVVVQSGQKKVAAFVNCGGQKVLRTFEDKNKIVFWHFPFVRGIQHFFCGLAALFSAFLLADDVCAAKDGTKNLQKSENKPLKKPLKFEIKKGSKNFKNAPENAKSFKNVQEAAKSFKNVQENAKSLRNVQKNSGKSLKNTRQSLEKSLKNEQKTEIKTASNKANMKRKNSLSSLSTKYYQKKLLVLGLVLVGAAVASAIWLGWLPGKIAWLCVGASGKAILRNLLILGLKIAFFYVFLLFFRIFPQINELFRFNRAADVAQICGDFCKTKRKKCPANPTNFLNFVVFAFILDTTVLTLVGASFGFWFNKLFHVAILLACIAVADEILRLIQRFPKLWNLAFVTAVLVCERPSTTHLETTSIALTEINLLENQKEREFMAEDKIAFSVAYNEVKNKLLAAGISDKSDVDWLFATVLGKNRAEIKLVAALTEKQYQDVLRAANRRAKGESLDNIFGFTEFFGLRFDVNKKVLTPRMETEILVENVIKAARNLTETDDFGNLGATEAGNFGKKLNGKFSKFFEGKRDVLQILDLGTGSGAIAVTIAKNVPNAQVVAVDVSPAALAVAQNNAKKNAAKVEFLQSNLFDGLKKKQKFDIIVSNPPYIKTEDIKKLDKTVRECDPILALDGGEDGLEFYRKIVSAAPKHLKTGGQIFFEVGKGQAVAVRKILRDAGFEGIKTIKDYNKIERVVFAKFAK